MLSGSFCYHTLRIFYIMELSGIINKSALIAHEYDRHIFCIRCPATG